jgi:hypothetical protein
MIRILMLDFRGRVVTQLTNDVGKVFSKLHLLPIEGKMDFCKGIKVANVSDHDRWFTLVKFF